MSKATQSHERGGYISTFEKDIEEMRRLLPNGLSRDSHDTPIEKSIEEAGILKAIKGVLPYRNVGEPVQIREPRPGENPQYDEALALQAEADEQPKVEDRTHIA